MPDTQSYCCNSRALIVSLTSYNVHLLSCKSWDCPHCSVRNARLWAACAIKGCKEILGRGNPLSSFCLTQPGKVKSKEFAYRVIPNQWDKFRRKMQATGKFSYFCTVEAHTKRAQIPHMHVLCDRTLNPELLKKDARSAGFGWSTGYQEIAAAGKEVDDRVMQACKYLAKYDSKAGRQKISMPKGFRRIRTSQNWPTPKTIRFHGPGEDYMVIKLSKETEKEIDVISRLSFKREIMYSFWALEDSLGMSINEYIDRQIALREIDDNIPDETAFPYIL